MSDHEARGGKRICPDSPLSVSALRGGVAAVVGTPPYSRAVFTWGELRELSDHGGGRTRGAGRGWDAVDFAELREQRAGDLGRLRWEQGEMLAGTHILPGEAFALPGSQNPRSWCVGMNSHLSVRTLDLSVAGSALG